MLVTVAPSITIPAKATVTNTMRRPALIVWLEFSLFSNAFIISKEDAVA